MATMIPALSNLRLNEIGSRAELRFYSWCRDALPNSFTVFYSLRWTYKEANRLRDGEADFVICDENGGVLIVEVKGGGVRFDPLSDTWQTIDRNGKAFPLKRSPIAQARDSKYTLQKFLDEAPAWRRVFPFARPRFGHAAFFPDLDKIDQFVGIDAPPEVIGGRLQGGDGFQEWASRANGSDTGHTVALGPAGVSALVESLVPAIDVRPLLRSALDEAELQRVVLSTNQSATLSSLSRHNRASITGGAGTGKTILAVEKAKRLAADGNKTLLLCYNRPLARMLSKALEAFPNAGAQTFHEFCGRMILKVKQETRRDLKLEVESEHKDWDLYDQVLPEALARAAEMYVERFDAIVVDEGQDFKNTYWFPIELFTRDEERGTLYIFFDENQRLYGGEVSNPIKSEPFLLTRNCRNAVPIHRLAYKYYDGDTIEASQIAGEAMQIFSDSIILGARAIAESINDLIGSEGVEPGSICVLIAGSPKFDYIEKLESTVLAKNVKWRSMDDEQAPKSILIATVQQFKGLESEIVYLWGIDSALDADRGELIYVGASRAKSRLYTVGAADLTKT
jgi:hypothetical protein